MFMKHALHTELNSSKTINLNFDSYTEKIIYNFIRGVIIWKTGFFNSKKLFLKNELYVPTFSIEHKHFLKIQKPDFE